MPTIIDKIVASDRDDKEELQEQDEFLKSLLQVNEDDILSRVLCADIPATRASATDSVFSGLPLTDAVKFSEEVRYINFRSYSGRLQLRNSTVTRWERDKPAMNLSNIA